MFVSNGSLSWVHTSKLSPSVDAIFERTNVGFDFYVWQKSIDREGLGVLAEYDIVKLMNDSWFGPLFDMGEAYNRVMEYSYDFWGMIISRTNEKIIPEL